MARVKLPESALGGYVEKSLAPDGLQLCKIVRVKSGETKKGNPMTMIVFSFPELENTKDMIFNLNIPYDGCHDMITDTFKLFRQTFGFEIDEDGFDDENLIGLEAELPIITEMYEGRNSNSPVFNV